MDSTPSPSKLDEAQVRHVAKLSQLKLSDAEIKQYATELTSVLGYIRKLTEVNIEGVEPMAHPLPLTNVWREDVVEESLPIEKIIACAPATDGPFITVPKVLDGGSA